MCISKLTKATKQVAKFIRDNTNLDYCVARNCIAWAFKLYTYLDEMEKRNFIKYINSELNSITVIEFDNLKEDPNVEI